MSETAEIRTVSSRVERDNTRRSLPQRDRLIKPILRHSKSVNRGQAQIPVPATIPEVEVVNEKAPSRTASIQSHNHSRGHSKKSETSNQGYENQAYDGPMPDRQHFDNRGASARSSRNSSVQSLEVQKEQYCCFSRWSPCERKLVALVAVLATIIIILLFIVSFMAGGDEKKLVADRFLWKF